MNFAQALLGAGKIWLMAGSLVAACFLLFGLDRTDAGSHRAYAFRPLLVPGILLLWPLVLLRWRSRAKPD